MSTDSREEFEAWCRRRWAGDRNALTVREDGEYLNGHVQFAWAAWQAALATKAAEPAEQMVTYTHCASGARFRQRAIDPLPPWAYDVRPEVAAPPPAPLREPPEGWVLVPLEATPEMVLAFQAGSPGDCSFWGCWRAACLATTHPARAEKKKM